MLNHSNAIFNISIAKFSIHVAIRTQKWKWKWNKRKVMHIWWASNVLDFSYKSINFTLSLLYLVCTALCMIYLSSLSLSLPLWKWIGQSVGRSVVRSIHSVHFCFIVHSVHIAQCPVPMHSIYCPLFILLNSFHYCWNWFDSKWRYVFDHFPFFHHYYSPIVSSLSHFILLSFSQLNIYIYTLEGKNEYIIEFKHYCIMSLWFSMALVRFSVMKIIVSMTIINVMMF